MATSEERLKILQMIQEGKISAEDGAKLLEALNKGGRGPILPASPRGPGSTNDSRYLRVRVTNMDTGKAKVSVNLPLSLVDAGMSIASSFAPNVANADIVEAISSGMTGKVIDVLDEEDREHVEIFIE
jgi:hypothetical protein